jgi:triphosphatase
MSTELELKFFMPAAQLPQLVALVPQLGTVQRSETAELLNAYFDTADNWFRRHDMGLRSRLKRGRYEQTIKLAGTRHGAMQMRPEYNVPCADVKPQLSDFPSHIWPATTNVTALQAQLTELFRTNFTRHSWQVQCHDGSIIELAYDSGQVLAADRSQPISELELELISGDAQQLFTLAQRLLQQLPLATGWQSKAARGYRLAAQQALTLPAGWDNSLLAQTNALQQAEACYQQQPATAALAVAATALADIAITLQRYPALETFSAEASRLAEQLATDGQVFTWQQYHMLLLAISQYLYHHG